jgi:hypothetical protein
LLGSMPFPLAHPAAVLPLRRYCRRQLSLPALVLGSMAPDAGYLLASLGLDKFAHTAWGSISFDLPVGLVAVGLFYRWRASVVERLPQQYRELFRPACQRPTPSPVVLLVSVLLGVWSHLLWDGFTHKGGWFVQHIAFLQLPIFALGHHQVRVCYMVWYGSSFLGIGWLYWTYQQWRQSPEGGSRMSSRALMVRNAGLLALLCFPVEVLHHLFDHPLQTYSVGALTLAMVLVALWKLDRDPG